MAIDVITRSDKGSALTFSEMDDNFDDLANSAETGVEGNVFLADQTEHDALSSTTKVCVPGRMTDPINSLVAAAIVSNSTADISGTDGFWRDENTGILIQWGQLSLSGSGSTKTFSKAFSIPFPSAVRYLAVTALNARGGACFYTINLTTCTGSLDGLGESISANLATYVAIGY